MIQVAVVSNDSRLEDLLRTSGLRAGRIPADALNRYAQDASAPAAIVIDVRGQQQLPAGIAALRRSHPSTGIVLVASTPDPSLMLEAMRAGVNEWMQEPITAQGLDQIVRRVIVGSSSEPTGQVLAFVGAKGGVGTTTLAVNTAAALTRGDGGSALLIDMNVGYGDAALFLGVEPRFSVLDAVENVDRIDESFFRGIVEKSKAGVDLLAASDRIVPGGFDGKRVGALLEAATRTYRFTVLDVHRSDLALLDSLETAQSIVLVTSQDLSSLRTAGRLAHMLRTRYGAARLKVVMSRFDRRADLAHADVERVVGSSLKHLIPSDYRLATDALNLGRPVVLDQTPLADALKRLAADLSGAAKPTTRERSSGLLGRLALRRA